MNVIHIAPIGVAKGIIAGAKQVLAKKGMLIFYGPFHVNGRATGPGNDEFDITLRKRNPEWGIRDLHEVAEIAAREGFGPPHVQVMPADNRLVIFEN